MKFAPIIAVALAAAGCGSKEPAAETPSTPEANKASAIKENPQEASAWESLVQKTKDLGRESSEKALAATREQALELQSKLADVKMPSELEMLRLETVQNEIARLSRAMDLQNLEQQMNDALAKSAVMKENAKMSMEQARAKLAETDSQFRELVQKWEQTKQTYDEHARKIEELKQKISTMTGSNEAP